MFDIPPNQPQKGRGASSNRIGRFEPTERVATSDSWEQDRRHRWARRPNPVAVLAAPMIPALSDSKMEAILEAAQSAGASAPEYIMLR